MRPVTAQSLSSRLFDSKGPGFEELVGATVRRVTSGIIGVAFIQSSLAAFYFLVAGFSGAGFLLTG